MSLSDALSTIIRLWATSRYSPLFAVMSGAATVLAFAPFGWYAIAIVALVVWYQSLYTTTTPRAAFLNGWLFGLGLFGFGVAWIRISLNEFGNLAPPFAIILTVLLIAAMALYYAVTGVLLHWLMQCNHKRQDWIAPVMALPAVWVLFEWLRGWLFTGFPWLTIGNSQVDSPLVGFAACFGVYGLSLMVALSAGLIWSALHHTNRMRVFTIGALTAIWLAGWLLQRIEWTQPTGQPLTATVVQGNIQQAFKWQPDMLLPTIAIYLELTRPALEQSDLIVWPETAIPEFLHTLRAGLFDPLTQQAWEHDTNIVVGIPIMVANDEYYNALMTLGQNEDQYYKRHLVPFGEYLPFRELLQPLIDWFEVPLSAFSRGTADKPLLKVGELLVGASICYEDVFPTEVRQALPEAAYLINVSNDAWFGDSLAPPQHLEFARLRAIENSRDLIRATNTGISAIIDWRGRLLTSIPVFTRATATASIQPRQGHTPFSRFGNAPVLVLINIMLLFALWRRGQHFLSKRS
ncbi:apolipoprotein N-acyltransferase [Rhodopseudomonas palustris]|uniref:Apolipoprotein N-acyltransferase n=1 Tax=Thiospirillum jenense TaxID=1653858 RepID=A0A839H899_9GAMM|nr:apolipoprotein N-acyltransferase [Thiospirillum jenense]MBB1089748.1 apolipoprotein N-acyltransferase [Rhodopseudomonas palustris]MBB1124850.1 apolipoprotein N-acyltransferase [Thiospirillum jenense]